MVDHYWFQRADFEGPTFKGAALGQALAEFSKIDWGEELALEARLEAEETGSCPPGFGLVSDQDSKILHLMPRTDDEMTVYFHHSVSTKLLGFIPWSKSEMVEAENVPRFLSTKLIQFMFSQNYESIFSELKSYER